MIVLLSRPDIIGLKIAWGILVCACLVFLACFLFWVLFIRDEKIKKKKRKEWIEEIKARKDVGAEYKAGFIDGIMKTEEFDDR